MSSHNLSHQDIDWDLFSSFEDDQFKAFNKKIKIFFESENIILSDKEIYALFGPLISDFALPRFILNSKHSENFPHIRNSFFHPSLLIVELIEKCDSEQWYDLEFFHRHGIFEAAFEKISEKKIVKLKNCIKKKISFIYLRKFNKIKTFGFFKYGIKLIRRIIFILINKEILDRKRQINILGSAHGIYSNVASILLCCAIRTNGKIIVNQPGFFHLQAKYIYQVKYELNLATKYIGWGGSKEIFKDNKQLNIEDIGSMYSYRMNDYKLRKGGLVLLPQVPSNNYRGFSFYWMNRNDFLDLVPNLIIAISELQKIHKTLILRCKSVDKIFYKKLLLNYKLDAQFQFADINNGEQFDVFEKTYITYFSTGIVEAFYKGSDVQLLFGSKTYLAREEVLDYISFFNLHPTDQKNLDKYISIFAKSITPKHFAKRLNTIINS